MATGWTHPLPSSYKLMSRRDSFWGVNFLIIKNIIAHNYYNDYTFQFHVNNVLYSSCLWPIFNFLNITWRNHSAPIFLFFLLREITTLCAYTSLQHPPPLPTCLPVIRYPRELYASRALKYVLLIQILSNFLQKGYSVLLPNIKSV